MERMERMERREAAKLQEAAEASRKASTAEKSGGRELAGSSAGDPGGAPMDVDDAPTQVRSAARGGHAARDTDHTQALRAHAWRRARARAIEVTAERS